MLVYQAFRYELAPTAAQRVVLANHAGAARLGVELGPVDPTKGLAASRRDSRCGPVAPAAYPSEAHSRLRVVV